MKAKKWNIWLAAVLLTTLTVTGYFAIAAEYGSKDDPLVTLSYINDVLSPEMTQKIEAALAEKQAAFDEQIDGKLVEANAAMDAKLAEYRTALAQNAISDELVEQIADRVIEKMGTTGTPSTPTATAASTWSVVQIPAGRTVVCEIGCQIVLRINAAACYSPGTVGLIDLSDGTTLGSGGALVTNHLYLVTIAGRGFTTANGCTVLLSGSYTFS